MSYSKKELVEIERVQKVFMDYLNQSSDFDLVWSKKVGYIWLILTSNPFNRVDTGRRIESAVDLCRTCLTEIAMGVICTTENDHMPESADALEQLEIRRRWQKYMVQLPEYAYLCEEVLGRSK